MSDTIQAIYTIGVYDSTEDSFFSTLTDAGITVFCDVRARRGLRGKRYAYANSTYLQVKLNELDIRYRYFLELSPSKAAREAEMNHAKKEKIPFRQRTQLTDTYIQAYQSDILANFNASAFISEFDTDNKIVLFCVEGTPTACHRSLLAQAIADELNIEVKHLIP